MASKAPIAGKTIVITGASSGIGRAAAVQLAAKGAKLLLVAGTPLWGLLADDVGLTWTRHLKSESPCQLCQDGADAVGSLKGDQD